MYKSELNPGKFCIVKLLTFDESGSIDDPQTYFEFWDAAMGHDPRTGQYEMLHKENGPIFDRHGNPRRDWNQDVYRPVIFCDLDTQEVYSGACVTPIRYALCASREQKKQDRLAQALQNGRDLNTKFDSPRQKIKEKAKHLLRYQYHKPTVVARKHLKQDRTYNETMAAELPDYTEFYARKEGLLR